MKVRNGFVSNSSTSSFVLFGIEISEEKSRSLHEDGVEEFVWNLSTDNQRFKDLQASRGYEEHGEDEHFVGLSPNAMKDDETLLQFKQRIAALLTEAGLPTEADKVKLYSDAGRDG